jgi:hypothetical protein
MAIRRFITFFVPTVAVLLVGFDVFLNYVYGPDTTYTRVIRSAYYEYPSLAILLSASLGAVWAHLCWVPGASLQSMRREFKRLGGTYLTVEYYGDFVTPKVVSGDVRCPGIVGVSITDPDDEESAMRDLLESLRQRIGDVK